MTNIITFLLLVVIGFLWIKAFKILFRKEFIFGFMENAFNYRIRHHELIIANTSNSPSIIGKAEQSKRFLIWLRKPVYGCPYCMSSLHGLTAFTLTRLIGIHELPWACLLAFIPVLMGLVTLYYFDPYDQEEEGGGSD